MFAGGVYVSGGVILLVVVLVLLWLILRGR